MPRQPRSYLPGIPAHVVQRASDRRACFFRDADYRFYLRCLAEASVRQHVALHAYVLMPNHVHLLMTPARADGIPRVMQSLGRRYVQYANRTYGRSGTLWEGRHKGSLVDSDRYLLACHRYIELNPVRAGLAAHPRDYVWSSHRANAHGAFDPLLSQHPLLTALGGSPRARRRAYRGLFDDVLDDGVLQRIRAAAAFSAPLGSENFISEVERRLGRRVGHAARGRPRGAADARE